MAYYLYALLFFTLSQLKIDLNSYNPVCYLIRSIVSLKPSTILGLMYTKMINFP